MTSDQLSSNKMQKVLWNYQWVSIFKNSKMLQNWKPVWDYFLMITDDDSEPLQNTIFYSTSNFYTNVACYGMKLGFSVFCWRHLMKNWMKTVNGFLLWKKSLSEIRKRVDVEIKEWTLASVHSCFFFILHI